MSRHSLLETNCRTCVEKRDRKEIPLTNEQMKGRIAHQKKRLSKQVNKGPAQESGTRHASHTVRLAINTHAATPDDGLFCLLTIEGSAEKEAESLKSVPYST